MLPEPFASRTELALGVTSLADLDEGPSAPSAALAVPITPVSVTAATGQTILRPSLTADDIIRPVRVRLRGPALLRLGEDHPVVVTLGRVQEPARTGG